MCCDVPLASAACIVISRSFGHTTYHSTLQPDSLAVLANVVISRRIRSSSPQTLPSDVPKLSPTESRRGAALTSFSVKVSTGSPTTSTDFRPMSPISSAERGPRTPIERHCSSTGFQSSSVVSPCQKEGSSTPDPKTTSSGWIFDPRSENNELGVDLQERLGDLQPFRHLPNDCASGEHSTSQSRDMLRQLTGDSTTVKMDEVEGRK